MQEKKATTNSNKATTNSFTQYSRYNQKIDSF